MMFHTCRRLNSEERKYCGFGKKVHEKTENWHDFHVMCLSRTKSVFTTKRGWSRFMIVVQEWKKLFDLTYPMKSLPTQLITRLDTSQFCFVDFLCLHFLALSCKPCQDNVTSSMRVNCAISTARNGWKVKLNWPRACHAEKWLSIQ